MDNKNYLALLEPLYGRKAPALSGKIQKLADHWKTMIPANAWTLTQRDSILIAYPDSFQLEGAAPLEGMSRFLDHYVGRSFSGIHLLPMFPYTSDDGFAVSDYRQINPKMGSWDDIARLSRKYDLMFDSVINHTSKACPWFRGYLENDPHYRDYYIAYDPSWDYHTVVRPRALPLFTEFPGRNGPCRVWTTFSPDQVDLNYRNPAVLLEVLDLLALYASRGARYIRLAAVSFLWKESGTSCCNLEKNHLLIKLFRAFLEETAPGTMIVTETNVPHHENIAYFGNGSDEANMVYQFALPPLVLHTYLSGDVGRLADWLEQLEYPRSGATYFNFLSSHDGIGLQPVRDILSRSEMQALTASCLQNGGQISYKSDPDGSSSPYELNINYLDAITGGEASPVLLRKYMGSQLILLSLRGVPGVYYHSLLGSHNDTAGMKSSGINRRINREKLTLGQIAERFSASPFQRDIYHEYIRLLGYRRQHPAFSPDAEQTLLRLDSRVFSIVRGDFKTGEGIAVLVNISGDALDVDLGATGGSISDRKRHGPSVHLDPYEYQWILLDR